MTIPLFDLKPQNEKVRSDVDKAIARVLDSGRFILGDEVQDFEEAAATLLDVPHAVGVSSGTCALITSFIALSISEGDEVVIPDFTYAATAMACRWVGARPVLADIDPETFNVTPSTLERVLTDRTRAVVPVHLFGRPADMDGILELCRDRPIHVVEDAAQSFGASLSGRQTGTMGDLGCYSFYPTKPLGGFGDGGLVTVSEAELDGKLRIIRGQGDAGGYTFVMRGSNFRLDALQAAPLAAKLPLVEVWRLQRERAAGWYSKAFATSSIGPEVTLPAPAAEGMNLAWALYVIRAWDRDALMTHLRKAGVGCAVYYPGPLHTQEAFADLGYGEGDFPESLRASREVLALPMFAGITKEQVSAVVDAVAGFYRD
ncbi:MAG: DegT/DnrJ/EryC1/StrS family aminotransferase [Planctomycetota bacterium]|jgi:dTDP-4-amino-4,6-dideoxygalactose transaminase